jgi:hypothetical protein
MKAKTLAMAVAAFLGGGALAGFVAFSGSSPVAKPGDGGWVEMRWPFPMDQWGEGQAFRCGKDICGETIDLFVRAKIGFCNCTTGIGDDDELDRVSDFDLIGHDVKPIAPGKPVAVDKGSARRRLFETSGLTARKAMSFAFNRDCDAVVVTALAEPTSAPAFEEVALRFATGDDMKKRVAALLSPPR